MKTLKPILNLKVKDIIRLKEGDKVFTHVITSIETRTNCKFIYLNGNENSVSEKFIADRIV